MNYFKALEIIKEGKGSGTWHYTRQRDKEIYPTGYCGKAPRWLTDPIDPDKLPIAFHSVAQLEAERAKFDPAKFHEDGHPTKEAAEECYKTYLLDQRFVKGTFGDSQHPCRVCKAWTQGYVEIDGSSFVLCDEHANREEVAKLLVVGEIWSS